MTATVALGLLGLAFAQPAAKPRREITLTTRSVPLSTADEKLDRTGLLRYMGGFWITSDDHGLGGLSALSATTASDGLNLLAISDVGDKFTAHLSLDHDRPRSMEHAVLEPLLNEAGQPIAGKAFGDAESLSLLPDGRVLVGFEQHHRIWAYSPGLTGPANVFDTPEALQKAPSNGGLESIANWSDGRILAITEQMKAGDGNRAAFLFQGGAWSELQWKPSAPGFDPSDATVLPNGDLLVLERFWSALAPTKLSSRILRVKGSNVKAGAVLEGEMIGELTPPLTSDNFEGIAAFTNSNGKTEILIVSDDNFNSIQRTLLLAFEIQK